MQHRQRAVSDPSGSLASVSARNSRHLCTTVSDAPGLAAKFSVAAWLATMASDNGRRPKGVVEKFRSMTLLSCFGQSRNARRIGAPTLTRESERLIRIFAKRTRRLSSWFAAWGPFFLLARLFPSGSFQGGSELPADRRTDQKKLYKPWQMPRFIDRVRITLHAHAQKTCPSAKGVRPSKKRQKPLSETFRPSA